MGNVPLSLRISNLPNVSLLEALPYVGGTGAARQGIQSHDFLEGGGRGGGGGGVAIIDKSMIISGIKSGKNL